mgnify:CR=1 FL=1
MVDTGETSVLVGQSGMGKSRIVKGLVPHEPIVIGEISETLDSGKHTTRHSPRSPSRRKTRRSPAQPSAAPPRVAAAKAAFPAWRDMPLLARSQIFFAFRELVYRNREEMARLITRDHGKTWTNVTPAAMPDLVRERVTPHTFRHSLATELRSVLMGHAFQALGHPLRLRIVGSLRDSALQGEIIVGDAAFKVLRYDDARFRPVTEYDRAAVFEVVRHPGTLMLPEPSAAMTTGSRMNR